MLSLRKTKKTLLCLVVLITLLIISFNFLSAKGLKPFHMIKGESEDSYNNLITSVSNQINSLYNDYITKLYEYNNSTSESLNVMEEDNKVKATFFCLVRESEIDSLLPTIRSIQTRFNNKFEYPWIFVSDEEFSDNFKEIIQDKIPQNVSFGVIPKEHWSYPDWIDQKKAEEVRNDKSMNGIPYFNSESYRHMCRYESGFFYRHPLLNGYEYYWRVEPDTQIFCDLDYDVFQWMKDNDKKYGFTLTMREFPATIPTLWSNTQTFLKENPEYIAKDNLLNFISNDGGKTYNMCHFWTNFEIAAIDFWESEAYSKYFEFLDHNGGFFYERWGDAPVHSIAVSYFLNKDKIHFFQEIGYYHKPNLNCPYDIDIWKHYNCSCIRQNDFTHRKYSCGNRYFDVQGLPKPDGWDKMAAM